jgi:DNA-binding response OmpR family regulator
MRVLVVEDDVKMAAAIRRALHGAGVVADVTVSGDDAQWMVHAAEWAGCRRRRLPHQAVLTGRAVGAAACPRPERSSPDPTVVQVGSLTLDPATRQVCRGDTEVALSAKEFALLGAFMQHPRSGSQPSATP